MSVRDPVLDWAVSDGASPASLAGDAVSEVLDHLRVDAWFAGVSRLSHPFGVEVPVAGGGVFAMLSGSLLFTMQPGDVRLTLRAGDLLLLLRGDHFTVRTGEGVPVRPVMEVVGPSRVRRHEGVVNDGGPVVGEHLGAAIRLSGAHDDLVRDALPPYLLTRWDEGEHNAMAHCVAWLRDHASIEQPGDRACVNRHVALIVVEAVRRHLAGEAPSRGYLRALGDPQIGPVLGLMRSRLGHDWSVESLALESGLSRSAFCARFHTLVGASPAAHLRMLRVRKACEMLLGTTRPVGEIGRELGYGSDTAFGAAFKRATGMAPSEWRLHGR